LNAHYWWRDRKDHSIFKYTPPQIVLERLFKETEERYPDTPPASDSDQDPEFQDPESPQKIEINITTEK